MARRYTRREFVMDASFMFGCSILLHVFAPKGSPPSDASVTAQVPSAIADQAPTPASSVAANHP